MFFFKFQFSPGEKWSITTEDDKITVTTEAQYFVVTSENDRATVTRENGELNLQRLPSSPSPPKQNLFPDAAARNSLVPSIRVVPPVPDRAVAGRERARSASGRLQNASPAEKIPCPNCYQLYGKYNGGMRNHLRIKHLIHDRDGQEEACPELIS